MIYMAELLSEAAAPPPKIAPDCPNKVSKFPASVFSSEQKGTNIHAHFCKKWNSAQASEMTVDSSGNNVDPEIQLRRRTPPLSPSDFQNWKIELSYTPNDGHKQCSLDCNKAYLVFASACADSTSKTHLFFQDGHIACHTL